MKFFAGFVAGLVVMIAADYVLLRYSYAPEIYVIGHSEERSQLPFLETQFREVMEEQRKRINASVLEMFKVINDVDKDHSLQKAMP